MHSLTSLHSLALLSYTLASPLIFEISAESVVFPPVSNPVARKEQKRTERKKMIVSDKYDT